MKLVTFSPIIGLALFLYLIVRFEVSQIIAILSDADLTFLAVVLAINAPLVVLKGLKWKALVQTYPVTFPLARSIATWLKGFFIGLITPGRVGEATRAYYLRQDLPSGTGVSTVVMDRILDLIVLFSLALVGITMLMPFSRISMAVLFFLFLFLLFVLTLVVVSRKKTIPFFLRPLSNRFIPHRYKTRMRQMVADFYDGFNDVSRHKSALLLSGSLALLTWMGSLIQFYVLALALHLPLSLTALVMIMPVVVLLDALPISISGIGTRDAMLILLFSTLGIPAESAISYSLVLLFLSYIPIALVGMFLWSRDPFRRSWH